MWWKIHAWSKQHSYNILAANYDKEKDAGIYPKSFTIEGTMSENIVLTEKI